jgi:hypothetical protein
MVRRYWFFAAVLFAVLFSSNLVYARHSRGVYTPPPIRQTVIYSGNGSSSPAPAPAPEIRLEETAVRKINLAEKTIDIAINTICSNKFIQAVEAAAGHRGVKVRVISAKGNTPDTWNILSNMACRESASRLDEDVIIIDGITVLTGESGEYEFTLTKPEYLKKYQDKFENLWKNSGVIPLAKTSQSVESKPPIEKKPNISFSTWVKEGCFFNPDRNKICVHIDDPKGFATIDPAGAWPPYKGSGVIKEIGTKTYRKIYPKAKDIIVENLKNNGYEMVCINDAEDNHSGKKMIYDYELFFQLTEFQYGIDKGKTEDKSCVVLTLMDAGGQKIIDNRDYTEPYVSADDGEKAVIAKSGELLTRLFNDMNERKSNPNPLNKQ